MTFDKTDDELKNMSDDELFEYLDAKAKYLSEHTSPLSAYYSKRYAYISNAISNSDKGTDMIFKDVNYKSIKKIANENVQSAIQKSLNKKAEE